MAKSKVDGALNDGKSTNDGIVLIDRRMQWPANDNRRRWSYEVAMRKATCVPGFAGIETSNCVDRDFQYVMKISLGRWRLVVSEDATLVETADALRKIYVAHKKGRQAHGE